MHTLRYLLAGALVCLLPLTLWAGGPRGLKGGKGKAAHGVGGKVVEVTRDSDKDNAKGSITLKIHKKQPGEAGTTEERKFQILRSTRFVKIEDGKMVPAKFADVREGEHIRIRPADGQSNVAQVVEIGKHKSKPGGKT